MFRPRLWVGVLALALFSTGVLCGDDTKKDDAKSKGRLPPGWQQLNLSEKQKQKIYDVHTEYRAQIEALQNQLKALQAKERAEMVKVLTDDQRAKLRDITEGKADDTVKPEAKKPDEKKKTEEKKP
jgi:Spy/CpxP family protein refolding chaperone